MTEKHLKLRGIQDPRVLAAMEKVPRERFVPEGAQANAYDDRALPIGFEQTISQPYIVALMSELLELKGGEKILEVGTGSGYQAAILAELAGDVYSVEIVPALAERSAKTLTELGYGNIHLRAGDGYKGWPEAAPFDGIIVTCAPEKVPPPLIEQLKEGGKLVIPVGAWPHAQQLIQMTKVDGSMETRPVIPVSFVPMTGELK